MADGVRAGSCPAASVSGLARGLDCASREVRIRLVGGLGAAIGGRRGLQALLALSLVLFAAAIAVRAVRPARALMPEDVVESRPGIAEPMQLLSRGARLRATELDAWIAPERKAAFQAARQSVFGLQGCPPLLDWIDGLEGQRFERLLVDLRTGTREEAFSALVLTFQLSRGARWAPGILGRTQHAERLGGLLQDWLRVWGERSAKDPLLAEPALAAALVHGRVMRTAWRAPVVGYNRAPYDRAVAFLTELTGIPGDRRTNLGEALQARHPRAASKLMSPTDALAGLEEEAAVLFPDLTGECEE